MTQVDENRLKGNYGAAYVALRLSSEECLVRPVPSDTDVGVDLFCESVEDEAPFLHFWVQVKTGTKCTVTKKDGARASYSFERKHLRYWDGQPVPVFAALVPTGWPIRSDPTIYIVEVTSHLIENPLPETDSLMLYSKHTWQPGDQEAIRTFLKSTVPYVTAKMRCKDGVVAQIPTRWPSYVQFSPTLPVSRYLDRILNQVRRTSASSIFSMWYENTLNTKQSSAARRILAQVVAQFEDDTHWENPMALALSYHADGEHDRAIQYYQKAKESIIRDSEVAGDPYFQARVKDIEDQISKTQNKEPV